MSAPAPIRFEARPHVALHYHVLSHLDLGRDAASIFRPRPQTPWADDLLAAYRAAPGRLALQFAPLPSADLPWLLDALRRGVIAGLSERAADRALAARWADVLEVEAPPFVAAWRPHDDVLRRAEDLIAPLTRLRAALWTRAGRTPPPLTVLHVPALGRHGRGMSVCGERLVAVDLARPLEQALVQVFHEECHPVTDREVAAREDTSGRDTRAGTVGHARHLTVEAHAVAVGGELVAAHAPRYAEAYAAWRARYGM